MDAEPRIESLTIRGLFDRFDHRIPFNLKEHVTIIHGPNGIGKTTILRLISNLFAMRFDYLRRTEFNHLDVRVDNGQRLRVKRAINYIDVPIRRVERRTGRVLDSSPRSRIRRVTILDIALYEGRKKVEEVSLAPPSRDDARLHLPVNAIDRHVPQLSRTGPEEWLDLSTGETLSLEDVWDRYYASLQGDLLRSDFLPEWLLQFCRTIPVHLIETQRLFTIAKRPDAPQHRGQVMPSAVEMYSIELASTIQQNLARSAALSQTLDRTFPNRLMSRTLPRKATEEHIRMRYKEQGQLRQRLMEAGLLDTAEELALPERNLDDTERRVLWSYLEDVDEKLSTFDELLDRIELFKDIINTSFLYKRMSIGKEQGFVFTTDRDAGVAPSDLSSGEQHELVLAYQLLFKVGPRSLIMIDEPEISLHVTWQHKFLPDISRISEVAGLDFLIATHSPAIIHKSWDLMVPLEARDPQD